MLDKYLKARFQRCQTLDTKQQISFLPPAPPHYFTLIYCFFFFQCLPSSFSSSFEAKTFLLIRESVEENHRGVHSVLTLFIFFLHALSFTQVMKQNSSCDIVLRMHARRTCVCVTRLSYSDVVESSTQSQDVIQDRGSVPCTVTTAALPLTVVYFTDMETFHTSYIMFFIPLSIP